MLHTYAPPYVRWQISGDMPVCLAIEAASSPRPWTEEDFSAALRQRLGIGQVVEELLPDGRWEVRGFSVYTLHKGLIRLLKLAVDPAHRRRGFASAFIRKLAVKIALSSREALMMDVPEEQLGGQLFLRWHGFRAVAVMRDEGAYRFVLCLDDEAHCVGR